MSNANKQIAESTLLNNLTFNRNVVADGCRHGNHSLLPQIDGTSCFLVSLKVTTAEQFGRTMVKIGAEG